MDPLKILRKGLWITIINLAVADLIVCVDDFFHEMQIYVGTKELLTTENYCFVMNILLSFAISASLMLLGLFSLQVYTVTKFPFKAPHFWTRTKIVLCCIVIWLVAIPLALDDVFIFIHLDHDKYNKWWTVQAVVWAIIVIVQIVLKILTCWEIFKTRRNSGLSQSTKHRQITTTVMIMVAVQMFTAFPYIIIKQLLNNEFSLSYHVLKEITTYHTPILLLNFCVNPIIYFLRLPDYRSSLLSLFGCRKRKNQTSPDPQRNEQREPPLHQVPPTTPQPLS